MPIEKMKYHIPFLIILLVSIGLNLFHLDCYSLNEDEMLTLNVVTGFGGEFTNTWGMKAVPLANQVFTPKDYWSKATLANVHEASMMDSRNSILFDYLLYWWIKITRANMFNARFFSVLVSVISLVCLYLGVLKLFNDRLIACLACSVLAAHPLFLFFSHQIRCYSFGLTLSSVTLLLFVSLLKSLEQGDERKAVLKTIGLGIMFTALFFCHYLTIYLIGFYFLFLLLFYRSKISGRLIAFGMIPATVIFLTSALLWFFVFGGIEGLSLMSSIDKYILATTSPETHTSLKSILIGAFSQLMAILGNFTQYMGFRLRETGFLILFPLLLIALNWVSLHKKYGSTKLIFLIGAICFCILLSIVSSIKAGHTTNFKARYGIFVIPQVAILLAISIRESFFIRNHFKKILSWLAIFGLVVILIISSVPAFTGYYFLYSEDPQLEQKILSLRLNEFQKEPYQVLAEKIEHEYQRGDTVMFKDWNTAQYTNIFLTPGADLIEKVDTTLHYNIALINHEEKRSIPLSGNE